MHQCNLLARCCEGLTAKPDRARRIVHSMHRRESSASRPVSGLRIVSLNPTDFQSGRLVDCKIGTSDEHTSLGCSKTSPDRQPLRFRPLGGRTRLNWKRPRPMESREQPQRQTPKNESFFSRETRFSSGRLRRVIKVTLNPFAGDWVVKGWESHLNKSKRPTSRCLPPQKATTGASLTK